MKVKYFLLPLFLITFLSCNDYKIVNPKESNTSNVISYEYRGLQLFDDDTLDINLIIDSCGMNHKLPEPRIFKLTVWKVDHYSPIDGKIVGIWAQTSRLQNAVTISKLKNKFGFNYLFMGGDQAQFDLILNSGYSNDKIMVGISPGDYDSRIQQFGTVHAYYIDEPYERGYSIDVMNGIRNAINNYAPGSKLIISGYRRTASLREYVNSSDGILFSSYKHWYEILPGVWVSWPVDPDQRPDWRDMRNRYGEKSFLNWIGAHLDFSEYPDLLACARSLSLPGVWLYQLQEGEDSDDNILGFCHAAFNNGYLKAFVRKYIYEYHFEYLDPDDSGASNQCNKGWYLYQTRDMNDVKEVFPQD
ncbi:MAG: hypothetical protein V1720_16570 [bacterium]